MKTSVNSKIVENTTFAKNSPYLDTNSKCVRQNVKNIRDTRNQDIEMLKEEIKGVFDYRRIIWKMRNIAGHIQTIDEKMNNKRPAVYFCGKYVNKTGDSNILVAKNKDDRAFYTGLTSCSSVWRCPSCAYYISKVRQLEIYKLLNYYKEEKYEMSFVTLTVPHKKSTNFQDLIQQINENFRKIQRVRAYKPIKSSYLGMIKAFEITYGENGWHPHLHIIFIHNKGYTREELDIHMKSLIRLHSKRNGATQIAQDYKPVYTNEDISDYVTKWDVSKEISQGNLKNSSTTYFGMLRDISEKRKKFEDLRFEMEMYSQVTKHKAHLLISPKIREHYKIVNPDTKQDSEIVQEDIIESLIFEISPGIWKQIRNTNIPPTLLSKYEVGGIRAVAQYLYQKGVRFSLDEETDLKIPKFNSYE